MVPVPRDPALPAPPPRAPRRPELLRGAVQGEAGRAVQGEAGEGPGRTRQRPAARLPDRHSALRRRLQGPDPRRESWLHPVHPDDPQATLGTRPAQGHVDTRAHTRRHVDTPARSGRRRATRVHGQQTCTSSTCVSWVRDRSPRGSRGAILGRAPRDVAVPKGVSREPGPQRERTTWSPSRRGAHRGPHPQTLARLGSESSCQQAGRRGPSAHTNDPPREGPR